MARRRLLAAQAYLITIYATAAILSTVGGQTEHDPYREFAAPKGEKGLFPSIFNLATHAEIRATATCGQQGPEYYCKLVEHVFLRQPQCDICDANNHLKNHPIDYAIDGTRRWWQSPSLANGLSYEKVNITIDLRQEYQVAYVVIKAAISPRPGTWVLEKSLDGINFTPWQYYATSDSDCMRAFGVPAIVGVPKFERDDEVICTSYYSKLNPLENGEIHTSLVNGRPGANHTSSELQDFTRTRFVRLRLVALRTLFADLMVINRRVGQLDQSVTRRYFYSISDISIGGQCICYGHAERCPPEDVHGQFRCECRHNTCGESCSECCPLFNQLPWQPGTHDHPNICQACQCFNHATRCVYDEEVEKQKASVTPDGIFEGGGKCVDCQHNTGGINCEKCLPEFYRPTNVTHYRPDACRPCDCDSMGAESKNCIQDEAEVRNGLRPGDCICKPGFGGRRCDRCAIGFRNHPTCEPCPCNQAGSLNFATCEEERCICKQNVEGEFCDRCKPGTIYLDKENPQGCQACFCFGKSTECNEAAWNTEYITFKPIGWNLTDLYHHATMAPKEEVESEKTNGLSSSLIFNSDDYSREQSHSTYYWKAPSTQLKGKDLLKSYGSTIQYYVYFVPREGGGGGHAVPVADVVIEGNAAKFEYYTRLNFFPRENMSVVVPLRATENWYDARTRRPADKTDLMRVLADTENLYIRAKYHQDQVQSSIYGLRIESATKKGGSEMAGPAYQAKHPVEICTCPKHFEGQSCESCEAGYRRVGNQLYDGVCQKCECHGHSQLCDPHTGNCMECQHNTAGARCEQCMEGHYGNPSLGGEAPGSCKACACPTVENSHSLHCTLSQLVLETAAAAMQDEYVCTHCETGYEGNKCEECADGYFGDPYSLAKEEGCRPCECSGNTDPMAIGNCDRSSGECLRCTGHTAGFNCEQCEENHWGSALAHNCRPCNCHHKGAQSLQCNNATGTCECRENYTGERCDRCEVGHGDVEKDCPDCECDPVGSRGLSCDEVSGQCPCKHGVYGKHCDQCIPSYYNFTEYGCQFCHCNAYGAIEGKECDNVTGECQCQPNVEGLKCEKCMEGFFNISSGQGCQACDCDEIGAQGRECHLLVGQCRCKPGVAGLKCNKCEPNHYGLSEEGCKQCRVCPAPGQVCDPVTGECVCPPNTEGEMCERCSANAWNYHPYRGCELCSCDGIGADSSECDARTGYCKCKAGYVGQKCDLCEAGYYNFPDCQPCECDLAGTEPTQCRGSTCLCSNEGQCRCKKFATGLKCDECAPNSFSLEAHSATGCTECFCFGKGADGGNSSCSQSSLIWHQIYAPDRKVSFEEPFDYYTRKHNIHVLRDQPLNYNSYPTNHTPLYWPPPAAFLGDRTASYNGFIRFHVRSDDNHRGRPDVKPSPSTFRLFPQLLLIGNHRIELEHIPGEVPEDGKYKALYIRATYNDMARGDTVAISELSLDVAGEASTAHNGGNGEGALALGVEDCGTCAEGYEGLSCQSPLRGRYCRKRHNDFLNRADDLALVGWSAPCACNGHASECDVESCRCTDCAHHTVGDFCERCKPGYYGDATAGHADACRQCACPLAGNSFSETCHVDKESSRGYLCDACKPGYSGHYCESCSPGHYGDPSTVGGYCAPCACNPYGSLHRVCHNVTGQCECREGLGGRDCSTCAKDRHAFIRGVCTSCDMGCHKELMRLEDEMERKLLGVQNLTGIKPVPRRRLDRISDSVESIGEILDRVKSSENHAGSLLVDVAADTGGENRLSKQAKLLEQEFQLLVERGNGSVAKLSALDGHLDSLRQVVHDRNQQAVDTLNLMARFLRRAESAERDPKQIHYLITQAQQLLTGIRQHGQAVEKQVNYAQKNAEDAEALLKKVLSRKLNDTSYSRSLEELTQNKAAIREFRDTLWDQSKAGSDSVKSLNQQVSQKLGQLEKTMGDISRLNDENKEGLTEAEDHIASVGERANDIERMVGEMKDSNIYTLLDQQEGVSALLKGQEGGANSRVESAKRHADGLERDAYGVGRHFPSDEFSMDVLAASNAYSDIAHAMRNASLAAKAAKQNGQEAFAAVDPASESSLGSTAQKAAKKSEELHKKLDTMLAELASSERGIKVGREKFNNMSRAKEEITQDRERIRDVQEELDGHHDRINNVYSIVDEAEKFAADVQEKSDDFSHSVAQLGKRVNTITGFDHQAIVQAIKNVTKGAEDTNEMERVLTEARERSARHESEMRTIRQDLGVLKAKIEEAREKVSKVKVGVKSTVEGVGTSGCVREYVSPLSASPSNSIVLKYRPAMETPDSLIFFTSTTGTRTQPREYIAVELRSKKIHVKWDVGGGAREAAVIRRNIVYIPASDRHTWYHIELKRIANSMRVSVVQKQVFNGDESARNVDEPTEVSVSVGEPDGAGDLIFNTVPGETLFSFGLSDAGLADQLGLVTNRFYGTVGSILLDGTNVPLWVFATTQGFCDGHQAPRQHSASGHMFRNGFAQVRMPMSDRASGMIAAIFSSYSPNGLIYFRGSPASGDFLAIHLVEGSIELLMKSGERPLISLRSSKSVYADGKSRKVRVIRKDGEVHLQIDPDTDHVSTTVPGYEDAVPNILEPDHYVGGVPPNFNRTAFAPYNINFDGFFGCIQSIRPNQVSELDLDNPTRSQQQEAGCMFRDERLSTMDRVISFPTPGGYLQSKGFEFSPTRDSLSFGFVTRSRNALLVHLFNDESSAKERKRRRREADPGHITIYLIDGQLGCQLATAGSSTEQLVTTTRYNDGLPHTVFLSCDGDVVLMRVDDREVLRESLDDDTGSIGSADDAVLLLGGLPQKYSSRAGDLPTSESMVGCLSDLQHGYERFALTLQAHQGTTMGSCFIDRTDPYWLRSTSSQGGEEDGDGEEQKQFERKNSRQSFEPFFGQSLASAVLPSIVTENSFHDESYRLMPFATSSSFVGRATKRRESCPAGSQRLHQHINGSHSDGHRYGVTDSSHSRINFPDKETAPSYTSFTLEFHFRTSQKKGLLWVWASYKHYSRYFLLFIERGFITLEVKGHKEPKLLQYRAKRLNDNEWHSLRLAKDGRVVKLQVDELGVETLRDAPNPKVMRKRMYVGGVISRHRRQFSEVIRLPGFEGCLKGLKIDGVEQQLDTSARDVVACSHTPGAYYIHEGGFATFDALEAHETKPSGEQLSVEFNMQFRASLLPASNATATSKGRNGGGDNGGNLILAMLSTTDHAYKNARLILWAHNSTLHVSVHLAKHRIHLEERLLPATSEPIAGRNAHAHQMPFSDLLCPGQWHRLEFVLTTNALKLQLDAEGWITRPVRLSLAALADLRALPVHVGGVTGEVGATLGTSSLQGCLRELELFRKPIRFEEAKKLHKVVPDGCPY